MRNKTKKVVGTSMELSNLNGGKKKCISQFSIKLQAPHLPPPLNAISNTIKLKHKEESKENVLYQLILSKVKFSTYKTIILFKQGQELNYFNCISPQRNNIF